MAGALEEAPFQNQLFLTGSTLGCTPDIGILPEIQPSGAYPAAIAGSSSDLRRFAIARRGLPPDLRLSGVLEFEVER